MADLSEALRTFYAGDVERMSSILSAAPSLVHERVASSHGHYCGYFFEASLLHHVAGNPSILPLPATTLAMAELILDRGAEVDAPTHPGPRQPNDIGWSTLGLVATSGDARKSGHQRSLLELLIRRGADVNFRNGGPLIGALYYSELEAARFLVEHGARVDLIAAAGLGRIDLMRPFAGDGGLLRGDAHTLVHYGQAAGRPQTAAAILGVAMTYACIGGHRAAVEWLLAHGASASERTQFDHDATPLHWAALHGHREVCEALLNAGAGRTLRDASFRSTPSGWAAHDGHVELAQLLAP
ncbi:MAG: ankyrin repeat domain-containing protein [Planctomycetota bacterium]